MRNVSRRSRLLLCGLIALALLQFAGLARADYDCIEAGNCTYCYFYGNGASGYLKYCRPEQ